MPLVHDRAICIRKVEYSETSQILTLFTREHGRVQTIAKGAHRRTKAGASKFDGGVDLLDIGEAVFSHSVERDLSTLTEWHLIEGHAALHRDLRAMYLGLFAAELVTMLFEEHDPHLELFDRFERVLDELGTTSREETFLAFELLLLRESGYTPSLANCVSCGAEARLLRDRAYFSPSLGGLVCRNCESIAPDRIEIDPRLIGVVQTVLGSPARLPRLTRHQTDPINRVLSAHIEHTLGRRLRMTPWILDRVAKSSAPQITRNPPSVASS